MRGDLLFKRFDLRPQDEALARHDAMHRGKDFVPNALELSLKIDEGEEVFAFVSGVQFEGA